MEHQVFKGGIVSFKQLALRCGVEDPIESLRVVAYPEKKPQTLVLVERQLRGLTACFKCELQLQLILVYS